MSDVDIVVRRYTMKNVSNGASIQSLERSSVFIQNESGEHCIQECAEDHRVKCEVMTVEIESQASFLG